MSVEPAAPTDLPAGPIVRAVIFGMGLGAGWSCSPGEPPTGIEDPVATAVVLVEGGDQLALPGTPLEDSIRVRVDDQFGRPVNSVALSFTVTAGGGTVHRPTATTDGDGEATVAWTLGPAVATNRLEIVAGTLDPIAVEAFSWSVSPSNVAFDALGDSLTITAEVGDEEATSVGLSVRSENRWLHEVAVVDPTALARGMIVSTGVGSVRLVTHALGRQLDGPVVDVTLDAPLVFDVTQDAVASGSTVHVRGYAMDLLPDGALLLDGVTTAFTHGDSSEVRFDPEPTVPEECVLHEPASLEFDGVASLWGGDVQRPAEAEHLEVGEVRTVPDSTFCLRLVPTSPARYALAQVDGAWIEWSKTQAEPYWDTITFARHQFEVREAAAPILTVPYSASGPMPVFAWGGGEEPSDVGGPATAPAASPLRSISDRAVPWAVGDTVTYAAPPRSPDPLWTVVKLYPPNFVLAIPVADTAFLWKEPIISRMDSAFAFVGNTESQDLYVEATGNQIPISSTGSQQYMVFFHNRPEFGGNATCELILVGSGAAGVFIGAEHAIQSDWPASHLIDLLGHELTHAWDCWNGGLGPRWSAEGSATLLANEFVRRFNGQNLTSNEELDPWRSWADVPHQGHFTNGYSESSPFLWQLADHLAAQHGVPWTQAVGTVSRGAGEGWYGQRGTGPGLVARVRAFGDPSWDPLDARLDWVLSVAVDDRATGAADAYGIRALRDSWQWVEDHLTMRNIWNVYFYRGSVVAGQGSTAVGRGFSGSNGYVLVEDPEGVGMALQGSVSGGEVTWRILRYQ
jgi:hypothetical protein